MSLADNFYSPEDSKSNYLYEREPASNGKKFCYFLFRHKQVSLYPENRAISNGVLGFGGIL